MDEIQLSNMFKPFTQADDTITRKYGGTGLGLVISKRLAELMGGNITVQSVKDLGSRFCCRIKAGYNRSNNKLITSSNEINAKTSEYEQPFEGIQLDGKVLLIEDTPEIQGLVKAYLEDYGIEIETANNGEEGVKKALANDYDLLLMDIQMPVMNGKDATRSLRNKNYSKPIIALNNVDFPLPLMPTRAVIVPRGMLKLVSRRATCPLR